MTDLTLIRRRTALAVRPNYISLQGNGYLGGDFPDAVTHIEGVPAQTEISVFLHRGLGEPADGKMLARILTDVSGAWRVRGLNPNLRYDVICRYGDFRAQIMSNVAPYVE